jgi:hypothetical protein
MARDVHCWVERLEGAAISALRGRSRLPDNRRWRIMAPREGEPGWYPGCLEDYGGSWDVGRCALDHDELLSIRPDRDWPLDASFEPDWCGDFFHSPGWLLLAELNLHPWPEGSLLREVHLPALNAAARREGISPKGLRLLFMFDS